MSWKLRLGGMLKFSLGPWFFRNTMAKLPVLLLLSTLAGLCAFNSAFAASVSSGIDSGAERYVWGSELADASNNSLFSNDGNSVSTEIGYGLDLGQNFGLLTPYAGLVAADGTSRHRAGARLGFNSSAELQLEVGSQFPSEGKTASNLKLDGTVRW